MASNYTFQGWMGLDKDSAKGNMVWQSYTPKPFEETDVDIKVTHCGVCGSDLHTLRSGWVSVMFYNVIPWLLMAVECYQLPLRCWARDRWNSGPSRLRRQARQSWRSRRCWCSI